MSITKTKDVHDLFIYSAFQCGKTTLTNFLSESGEVGSGEYRPTKGCRILEFEMPNVTYNNTAASVEVELWDVSGDRT